MAHTSHKKWGVFFVIFCWGLVWLVPSIFAKTGSEVSVSLTLKNKSFSDTADLVSRQIGYIIKFEKTLRNVNVSGRFKDVPVEYFFQRILKGKNIIIDIDDKKKEILVKNFGGKAEKLLVTNKLNNQNLSYGFIDPMTGKSMRDINKIYALQEKNRAKRLNNPNTIDPMTGKKLSEIREILKKQEENYRNRQINPDAIDPVTGKTMAEVNQILKTQDSKREARLSDPNAVDPMSGKTVSELNAIFALQEKRRIERLNDPNTIDPMTGKTMAEINSILQQQEANRKIRISR